MDNKLYFNYHRHTFNSNTATIDCTVSNDDYAERAIELGHKWLASTEHGGAVGFVDAYMSAKKNKLHYVHAGEFYFVKNRDISGATVIPKHMYEGDGVGVEIPEETKFVKDKSNYHLMIVAKTRKAMEELNYIMTEANMNGYYYKPRIDLELLKLMPKGEYFVTTACLGGILRDYEKNKELFEEMIEIVGKENLFLEVQPHATEKQIEYNKLMMKLADIYGLKLIAGCDSHMIHSSQIKDRDYLLHSKGLIYEDEEGWYLDYPSYDILFNRFRNQNIWEDSQIEEFISNTLILADTEEIVIDTKMKIPTIFPDKDRNWRLNYLKKLMFNSWEKYKWTVPKNRWIEYVNEILLEFNIIELTKMEDYFISNYHIIKRGIELGGILTRSSRGSGASFFTNMLLGFTTIDRLQSKLPMLPQRFMSISRIIENNSSPDID